MQNHNIQPNNSSHMCEKNVLTTPENVMALSRKIRPGGLLICRGALWNFLAALPPSELRITLSGGVAEGVTFAYVVE